MNHLFLVRTQNFEKLTFPITYYVLVCFNVSVYFSEKNCSELRRNILRELRIQRLRML